MSDQGTTRRQFVTGAALAGTAAATASTSPGIPVAADLSREEAAQRATVVLVEPRIEIDPAVRARLEASGARFIELTDDPVRQWRGELATVLADPATRLFGVTRWHNFLMVRGLAAESRRHVRHESLDTGSGVLTWLIA